MQRRQSIFGRLLATVAAGGLVTAFTVSCDPVSGSVFVDRYDEDDFGYVDFGFGVDTVFFDPPFFGEVVIFDAF